MNLTHVMFKFVIFLCHQPAYMRHAFLVDPRLVECSAIVYFWSFCNEILSRHLLVPCYVTTFHAIKTPPKNLKVFARKRAKSKILEFATLIRSSVAFIGPQSERESTQQIRVDLSSVTYKMHAAHWNHNFNQMSCFLLISGFYHLQR